MQPWISKMLFPMIPDSNSQQPIRKRASQACQQCRLRKVKCDLVAVGPPCHNCRYDGRECIASASRRSRTYRLQKGPPKHFRASQPRLLPQAERITVTVPSTTSRLGDAAQHPVTPSDCEHDAHNTSSNDGSYMNSSFQPILNSTQKDLPPIMSAHSATARKPTHSIGLPSYIRPPQRDLRPDELEYLKSRGALSIPDPSIRDKLLLSFLLYVNPFLPVLDVQEFVSAIEGDSGTQVSLILFQAVMFAGTAFIDSQVLLDAGFEDRTTARAHFFQRIKLLYDFEWENDRVVLIQAILLHAYWYISGNDQKDPWYWLGICISLATSLGMNQVTTYANKDVKTCRLWRRIWWTCVSRDRITSITTRKPIQIKDEEINLPLLKFKDFDTLPYTTNICLLRDSLLEMDCVGKVMLADMFMSKINILLIIGHIIRHLYFLQGFVGSPSDWSMFYTPKKRQNLDAECICRLQEELNNWSNTLNTYCQLDYHDDGLDEIPTRIMRVHRAVLKLLQAMAQEALHRPQTFSRPQSVALSSTNTPTNKSRASVRQAATVISDILQTFREEDLLKYLPPLSIGCVIAATAWFLVEIRLEKKSPAELPSHQFHQCFRSLLKLRGIWPIAEASISMVSQMVANNQMVFAWNIRMLSRPIESNEAPIEESQQGIRNHQREFQAQRGRTNADLNIVYDSPHVDVNSIPSTYRAFMYPFPWTSSEFDFYNETDPTGYELFTEHTMEGYDVNSALESGISGYPSSVDATVHHMTNMPLGILPET